MDGHGATDRLLHSAFRPLLRSSPHLRLRQCHGSAQQCIGSELKRYLIDNLGSQAEWDIYYMRMHMRFVRHHVVATVAYVLAIASMCLIHKLSHLVQLHIDAADHDMLAHA